MTKIKSLAFCIVFLVSSIAVACWQDTDAGVNIAIVGVNDWRNRIYKEDYSPYYGYMENVLVQEIPFFNNFQVALPITVYVACKKVSEDSAASSAIDRWHSIFPNSITLAQLQYKIGENGVWKTAKTLHEQINDWYNNPQQQQNSTFYLPVVLFGKNSIDAKSISANDPIFIRLYVVSQNIWQSGTLSYDISSSDTQLLADRISAFVGLSGYSTSYQNGFTFAWYFYSIAENSGYWTPPFATRVYWNGLRKIE